MGKSRLEAFSDGVIAVIITIMVLELKVPAGHDLDALRPLIPIFASYVLSFIYVGIYWNNHHHLFHAVHHVDGKVLWLNLHLLFWLSLIPFVTAWVNESHFTTFPVAAYGVVLLMSAIAFTLLTATLIAHHGRESALATAIGGDTKGKISVAVYVVAIALAFVNPWVSCGLYAVVAAMWFIPDRRIEKVAAE
jgi:uncharacterized membrane protein